LSLRAWQKLMQGSVTKALVVSMDATALGPPVGAIFASHYQNDEIFLFLYQNAGDTALPNGQGKSHRGFGTRMGESGFR
jgi:hypothetical protein